MNSAARWIVTLGLLGGFLIGATSEAGHLRAWWTRREANRAYYRGDFEAALSGYERVRQLLPGNPTSHADPADSICQVMQSDPTRFGNREAHDAMAVRAAGYYLDPIRVAPPNAWAYSGLGALAGVLAEERRRGLGVDLVSFHGDPLESLTPEDRLQEAALVRAVQLEPRNFYYRDFLGYFYWTHGFWERAQAHVRAAVRLQPVLNRHFYLSDLVTVSPRVLAAVEQGVQDALDSGDTHVAPEQIHGLLAEVYLRLGELEKARASFEAAARLSDNPFMFEIKIGRIHVTERNDERALESFQRATELAPEYHRAWLELGLTYSRLGRHDEALDALKRARGLEPTGYQPAWHLAAELGRGGELNEAVRILDNLIRAHPEKREPYLRLIELYLQQGEVSRATDLARQLVTRYPDELVFQRQLEQLEAAAAR